MRSFLFTMALLITVSFFGQSFYLNPIFTKPLDKDSLMGFDEVKARATAISENYLGSEYKIKMYRLKREFINTKYHLSNSFQSKSSDINQISAERPSPLTGCMNEDFEASFSAVITGSNQISGWTILAGVNDPYLPTNSGSAGYNPYFPNGLAGATSCNLFGCCPMPPALSSIINCSSGYVDYNIGSQYPVFSVFGSGTVSGAAASNTQISQGLFGSKVLKLNNDQIGDYSIERISRTFSVTANNCYFQYALLPVMAPGHACCDAGAIQVIFTDLSNNSVITCPGYSLSAPSSSCALTNSVTFYNCIYGTVYDPTLNFGNIYSKWIVKGVDLTSYIGKTLSMDVVASDCNAGGHFGYTYFDAQCGSISLEINSHQIASRDSIVTIESCDTSFVLKAIGNFPSFNWSGPGGISVNTSTLLTTTPGMYTLTLNQNGLCSPITRTVNLLFKSVTISSSDSIVCAGNPVTLTSNGFATSVWSDGNTTPVTIVIPTITTTYSITGIDLYGCLTSLSLTQKVEECTGLNPIIKNDDKIFVYPNPNNGEFIVEIDKTLPGGELTIESMTGQLIYKQKVSQGKNSIKLKGIISGLYYYRVFTNKSLVTQGKLKID